MKSSNARRAASAATRKSPNGLDCPEDFPVNSAPSHSSVTSAEQCPAGVRTKLKSANLTRSRRKLRAAFGLSPRGLQLVHGETGVVSL